MINSINNAALGKVDNQKTSVESAGQEIAKSFSKVFDEVNKAQNDAEAKMTNLVTGKNKDISGTMISMEKAICQRIKL